MSTRRNAPIKIDDIAYKDTAYFGDFYNIALIVDRINDYLLTIDASFNNEANMTYVDSSLLKRDVSIEFLDASKAYKSYVDGSLNVKSDLTYVDTSLNVKTNITYVDGSLNVKADKSYVDGSLNVKVNISYLDTSLSLRDISINNVNQHTISIDSSIINLRKADPFQTPVFANLLTLDACIYKDFKCGVITGDTSINLINFRDGDAGMIELIMDASGGYTVTLETMFSKDIGGVAIDTTANADNFIGWRSVATDIVYNISQVQ